MPNTAGHPPAFDPDQWLDEFVRRAKYDDRCHARAIVEDIITLARERPPATSAGPGSVIKAWVAAIDRRLSAQLNEILHHPAFQKLESTWRGLHYLVRNSETEPNHLELRVLDVAKGELVADLVEAAEFDQSATHELIHEREYGRPDGTPYGLLVGGYEFDVRSVRDVRLLNGLARVAEAAQAVFVAAVGPGSLGMKRFTELNTPRDLAKPFADRDYAAWNAYRESHAARHVALTCPRVLAREVYGEQYKQVVEFSFEEDVDPATGNGYPWMSAAWAYAARVTAAFDQHGWLARTRGVMGGGRVEGLPAYTFPTDEGGMATNCPTEIAITERREQELEKLGFLSLIHCRDRPFAAFQSATSTRKPIRYNPATNPANGPPPDLGISYLLSVSRFSQFMMARRHELVGCLRGAEDVEKDLNKWVSRFVLPQPVTPADWEREDPARPLVWAEVKVQAAPDRPGSFRALLQVRPRYQLEAVEIPLRFVLSFHPHRVSPEWRTEAVLSLARRMDESGDFSAMPILADALEDAGCDNPDMLIHCRRRGTHARGCGVIDQVLGRA